MATKVAKYAAAEMRYLVMTNDYGGVGYSQPNRWTWYFATNEGGWLTRSCEGDCSSTVSGCYNIAFHAVLGKAWNDSMMMPRNGNTWTETLRSLMLNRGFSDIGDSWTGNVPDGGFEEGDVLLYTTGSGGHVSMCVRDAAGIFDPDNPAVAELWIDAAGDILGSDGADGSAADDTGAESRLISYAAHPFTAAAQWTTCLRHTAGDAPSMPSWYLEPDGAWGQHTGQRFREVMGVSAGASWADACKRFQSFLNWGLDAYAHKWAHGGYWVNEKGNDDSATWAAFQAWWNDSHIPAGHKIKVDGVYGTETITAMQHALNNSWAGSKGLALKP